MSFLDSSYENSRCYQFFASHSRVAFICDSNKNYQTPGIETQSIHYTIFSNTPTDGKVTTSLGPTSLVTEFLCSLRPDIATSHVISCINQRYHMNKICWWHCGSTGIFRTEHFLEVQTCTVARMQNDYNNCLTICVHIRSSLFPLINVGCSIGVLLKTDVIKVMPKQSIFIMFML